ncbi:DUF2189 domain-containing protein [Methylocapsa sp. S129]|uniref:DUF2189 domain-containing protein n=1 Tax=Methylocapsa sp. S129 TaxID=1641869 RepID=UPI00131B791D|nr:DUF2189 domain-containing protein [Methylocapsa sp. S129]
MTNLHVYAGHDAVAAAPVIRKIGPGDLWQALVQGADDFRAMPSHLAFLCLIYPLCGLVLAYATSQQNALQLLFPLASGFALIGPFAAIGLYEMSRRRELGQDTSWKYAFNVLRSPSIPAIAALGLLLVAIFVAWLMAAQGLYTALFGPVAPASYLDFLKEVVSTERGWMLIGFGGFIGFCFAIVALAISVVSFPLLLDRDVGAVAAVAASLAAVRENPVTMALWGLIVAAALFVGALPLFVGLAIVMPILGHATWHLYRKTIVRDPAQEHPTELPPDDTEKAAKARVEPHSFLFPER